MIPHPELDLWKTARPFLEKWLKEQTGPKNILKVLKKEIPSWVTLAPELPKVLHAYLKNNEFNNNRNDYGAQKSIDALIKSQKFSKVIFVIISILLIILFFKLL